MTKPVQEEQLEASAYNNQSTALLIDWQNSGSPAKSNNEVNRLVREILLHPEF